MKLCIPVIEDKGITSRVSDHFGSAPCFLMFELETRSVSVIANTNQHHSHGTCQPMGVLSSYRPDAVVCRGMGKGAVAGLNGSGIKVYLGKGTTAEDVITEFITGELSELSPEGACAGHGCH